MRIIAGEFRSRKLQSPPEKAETRPIPDRVKESLFSLLRGHFEEVAVLDAFAGTGSFGLEALSRGASFCTFIERDRAVARVLEQNIASLGCKDRCEIVIGDALAASSLARLHERVHIAFFDPPYAVVENALGWRRTRDQLMRALRLVDDGGYLIHRTPWPFTHQAEGDAASDRTQRGGPHARGDGSSDGAFDPPPAELSLDLADPRAEAALEAFEAQLSQIMRGPERLDVDLSLPGAVGPETHVYRHTAVHLYQASRAGPPGAAETAV